MQMKYTDFPKYIQQQIRFCWYQALSDAREYPEEDMIWCRKDAIRKTYYRLDCPCVRDRLYIFLAKTYDAHFIHQKERIMLSNLLGYDIMELNRLGV